MYVVEDTGAIWIEENKTPDEVRQIIHKHELRVYDYAVFKGQLIKNFN